MDYEQTVMDLIINAGEARSQAMLAMQHARGREWKKAEEALEESASALKAAHNVQTGLIGADEGEGKVKVTLILVHAQDHLMTAMLCHDMAKEIVSFRMHVCGTSAGIDS